MMNFRGYVISDASFCDRYSPNHLRSPPASSQEAHDLVESSRTVLVGIDSWENDPAACKSTTTFVFVPITSDVVAFNCRISNLICSDRRTRNQSRHHR